jgi:hypothetical protein
MSRIVIEKAYHLMVKKVELKIKRFRAKVA